jgi:hypothetical protein
VGLAAVIGGMTLLRCQVQQLPKAYESTHGYIFDMFNNASHWPKEVVVSYKYEVENDEDISRGLYLLYALGTPPITLPIDASRDACGPCIAAKFCMLPPCDVQGLSSALATLFLPRNPNAPGRTQYSNTLRRIPGAMCSQPHSMLALACARRGTP